MTQTLPEEYASVLHADGVDDNALLNLKGGNADAIAGRKGQPSQQQGGANGASGNASRLTKLNHALHSKLYLVIW